MIDRSRGKAASEAKKARGIVRSQNKRTVSGTLADCQMAVHISDETITYWQEQGLNIELGRLAKVRSGASSHALFGSDRHFYRDKNLDYH